MATQHTTMANDDAREARRVAAIFGVLTLSAAWPLGTLVAWVLAVTTGQGARVLIVGLVAAALLACACALLVARQTHRQHPLGAPAA
jgi:Na+-driven multidrug efflux pump